MIVLVALLAVCCLALLFLAVAYFRGRRRDDDGPTFVSVTTLEVNVPPAAAQQAPLSPGFTYIDQQYAPTLTRTRRAVL